jgi:hypothetical protein
MPIESSYDFNSYVDPQIGGVTATFSDISSGNSSNINIIIDQNYFDIQGQTIAVEGYQPRAMAKASDIPYVSINDTLTVHAITTNNGSTLTPETSFVVVNVKPDNVGMVNLVLALQ